MVGTGGKMVSKRGSRNRSTAVGGWPRSVSIPMPEGSRPGEFEVYVGFDKATPGAG
jgi:hypothetical protein